jgi:hypothetical protein
MDIRRTLGPHRTGAADPYAKEVSMRSDSERAAPQIAATPSQLSVTWTFTETYTATFAVDEVASGAGKPADQVAADPLTLRGPVDDELADLLTDRQDEDHTVGEPQVQITAVDAVAPPTLTELIDAGWKILDAEQEADQRSCAGRALAGLLVGLRREGIPGR